MRILDLLVWCIVRALDQALVWCTVRALDEYLSDGSINEGSGPGTCLVHSEVSQSGTCLVYSEGSGSGICQVYSEGSRSGSCLVYSVGSGSGISQCTVMILTSAQHWCSVAYGPCACLLCSDGPQFVIRVFARDEQA